MMASWYFAHALAWPVRVARGVDPRSSELTMKSTIGKEDDEHYSQRPSRACHMPCPVTLPITPPRRRGKPLAWLPRAGSGPAQPQTV